MVSALECQTGVLRSIHSSNELLGGITYTDNMPMHRGLRMCLIHVSLDSASVGQHDLRINALDKTNTYMSSIGSVSYLSCR